MNKKYYDILILLIILFEILIFINFNYKKSLIYRNNLKLEKQINLLKNKKNRNYKSIYELLYFTNKYKKYLNERNIEEFLKLILSEIKNIPEMNISNFIYDRSINGYNLYIDGYLNLNMVKLFLKKINEFYPLKVIKFKGYVKDKFYYSIVLYIPYINQNEYIKIINNLEVDIKKFNPEKNYSYLKIFDYFNLISQNHTDYKSLKNYRKDYKKNNTSENFIKKIVYIDNEFIFIGKMKKNKKKLYIFKTISNGNLIFLESKNILKQDDNFIYFKYNNNYFKVKKNSGM